MRNRLIAIIMGLIVIGLAGALIVLRPSRGTVEKGGSVVNKGPAGPRSAQALLLEAKRLGQASDYPGLKAVYQKLISDFPNHKEVSSWQKILDELNLKIIFSSLSVPGLSREYEVQPLDNLTKIARQFNTTVELLKRSNNLSSDRITPGRKLRVWTGKFSVAVDKSQNILILKSGDEIIKTYNVSTGANNSSPVGTFRIVNKLPNPTWFKSGAVVPAESPENILGTRWLGFDLPGFGIHGTTEPASIGKQATAGCVRMLNPEVEELYSLLPVGVEVTITD